MARRRDWSPSEVEAIILDYFEMLRKELLGQPYNKSEHRRRLQARLNQRTEGAIEYKHQNISAVLLDLGMPYIDGYKPQRNYQELLFRAVEQRIGRANQLLELFTEEVKRPAFVPNVPDILGIRADPPRNHGGARKPKPKFDQTQSRTLPNFLEREARNSSLGRAGEELVIRYERARLVAAGREQLAARIEHVSQTRGDHEGYDVLSFDTDGRERLIEVKTTGFGALTPFVVSRNQVVVSRVAEERFLLYRVYRFRTDPRFYALAGAITRNCLLRPSEFIARPRR